MYQATGLLLLHAREYRHGVRIAMHGTTNGRAICQEYTALLVVGAQIVQRAHNLSALAQPLSAAKGARHCSTMRSRCAFSSAAATRSLSFSCLLT